MGKTRLRESLRRLGACAEAIDWVGERDLDTAWRECTRVDWMLWLAMRKAGRDGWPQSPVVVRAACSCAAAAWTAGAAAGDASRAAEHRAMCAIVRRVVKPGRI
jgi:hypothetical protein